MVDIILLAVILFQALLHYIERRDLYNRLMSKDLTEYKNSGNPPPKSVPSAHDKVLKKWRSKGGDE
jgi:hypothetical protein